MKEKPKFFNNKTCLVIKFSVKQILKTKKLADFLKF